MKIDTYTHDPSALAADLVNTKGSVSGTDFMPDLEALSRFLEEHGFEVPPDLSDDDLTTLRRARERLKEVFFATDADAAAAVLNEVLAEEGARPRVERVDGGLRFGFAPREVRVGRAVTIDAAMGLAQMLVDSGTSRFGTCSADDCLDVFVDTSRNRSRRYCTDSCSSRSNVAAFRARRRSS